MNKKYYHIIIAVLVLLNVLSWRMWWEKPSQDNYKRNSHSIRNNENKRKGMQFFVDKLNLSEEQQVKFEELRIEYFSSVDSLKHNMGRVRRGLINNSNNYNSEVSDSLLKEMAKLKLQIEVSTMEHFGKMREECKPEQVELFDSLIIGMMDRNGRFGRRGGHRNTIKQE